MCNCVVALGNSTESGQVIFGKNSDRSPNEAHALEYVDSAEHADGTTVTCTYVTIPQVARTNACLLSRPCWLWGAEMGTNEHGLTIGNTALFTRVPYETGPGLTGMDLLRLALEQASQPREALDTITTLLETYGQGGNCGFRSSFYYHNSFLIADHEEAWVLETAGKHWAAERVKDVRATSNALTITTDYDLISADTISYAEKQGWHKPGTPFNFKKSYGGRGFYPSYLWTLFGSGDARENRLTSLLEQQKGRIDESAVMGMLRDHGKSAGADYTPAKGLFGNTVCMHAGFGPVRTDQTTGSMISLLTEKNPTHWLTGTSAPCTSVFKPVWLDSGLGPTDEFPTGQYNASTLWWKHESLHRQVLKDYVHRLPAFAPDRDQLEAEFLQQAKSLREASLEKRKAFTRNCFERADSLTAQWTETVSRQPISQENPPLYQHAWKSLAKDSSFYYGDENEQTTVP